VLCGVSFCIGRVRSADEPWSHAWAAEGGWPGGLTYAVGADNSREPKCGPATGCSFAARDMYDGLWNRYLNFKKGEVTDDEWYPDYDEGQDSTYEYESEEDDERLEYDSDDSASGSDRQDEYESTGDIVSKVVPAEVLLGKQKSDVFRTVFGENDPDARLITTERNPEPHFSYEGLGKCSPTFVLILRLP